MCVMKERGKKSVTSVVLALDTEEREDGEQSRSAADAGGTLLHDLGCGKSEKIFMLFK